MSRKRAHTHHSRIGRLRGYAPGEPLGHIFNLGGHTVKDPQLAIDWNREFEKRHRAAVRSGASDQEMCVIMVELDRQFFPERLAELDRLYALTRRRSS